jgi:hypothetical protein
VGSIVHKLRIRTLKKLVETSRQQCDALVIQFDKAKTSKEKSRIAREYDKTLKRTHAMQFLLELQERRDREAEIGEQASARRKTGT